MAVRDFCKKATKLILMKYAEFAPCEQLSPYIETYWVLQTGAVVSAPQRRIFADGCMEIFINVGSSKPLFNHLTELKPGHSYLGGTMSCSGVVTSHPDSIFVGIRFKPAGFAHFYQVPAEELVDKTIEFPDRHLMSLIDLDPGLGARLDEFFKSKLKTSTSALIPITGTVTRFKGLLTVDFLAREHHITPRTLERSFKREIGISPKLFIGIVKFMHASKRIEYNKGKDSLLRIAHEQGYYDHAHLTKEVKRYTGLNPSDIGLVNWHP
ncbi:DUF6597 domain-containing transcriptional factor [Mucilaginibacter sp. HD30]